MDKIYLNQMEFYGYHGVFPEENKLGQRFIVDLVLYADLSKAGQTDELTYTVNYAEAYQIVQKIVEGQNVKLVEKLAEVIADRLLAAFAIVNKCTVKVIKPDPPIRGHYHSVAVEITRGK